MERERQGPGQCGSRNTVGAHLATCLPSPRQSQERTCWAAGPWAVRRGCEAPHGAQELMGPPGPIQPHGPALKAHSRPQSPCCPREPHQSTKAKVPPPCPETY